MLSIDSPPIFSATLYMLIQNTMTKHIITVKMILSLLFCGIEALSSLEFNK